MTSKDTVTANQIIQKIKAAKDKAELQQISQLVHKLPSTVEEQDLFNIGSAFLKAKDFNHASQIIDMMAQDSSYFNPSVEELRAFLQFAQGDFNGALKTIEKLRNEADDVRFLVMKQKIFNKMGRKNEADSLQQQIYEYQSKTEIHSKAGGETHNDSPWEGME